MTANVQGPTRAGEYVDAGGVRTYYEESGAGEPLLLLHGGACTAETFDGQAPALAEHYRVYVPERRGHGRTPDVDGPMTYENMALDTIAFMEAVGIGSAHLVGWSDGALVGLLVALRRPELVRKLVLIGQFVEQSGCRPEFTAIMDQMSPQHRPPMFEGLESLYAAASPDGPEHFETVFAKLLRLWRDETGVTLPELAAVGAPTLVLMGDDDALTIEHAGAMQRVLPVSQLAVVPGASHALPLEKPALVNRLLLDFLAPEQTPKTAAPADMLDQPDAVH